MGYDVFCKNPSNVFFPGETGFSSTGKNSGNDIDDDIETFLKHPRENMVKAILSNDECGSN